MTEEREGLLGQDTGWETVVNKKKKSAEGRGRLDVATWGKFTSKDTVSFFFSEFPETHGAKEMMKAFRLYGEVEEVVIPPKRDRWGKRFGFARFSNVGDPRTFAIKLDNIIFGATKIRVNLPRFQREWMDKSKQTSASQQMNLQRKNIQQQKTEKTGVAHQVTGQYKKGQRMQKVWKKKEGGETREGERRSQEGNRRNKVGTEDGKTEIRMVYHRKNNMAEVCYNVHEEEMQRFKKMYVGIVKTPGSTYYVQEWFSMQGFFSIKITPMGANKVVIEELDEGVIEELLTNYKDWFYEKFDDISCWDPDVVDNESVVWVRCHGIPLHAWNDEFFASLARNFGEYLGVDEATRTKSAVDVARIRLRSNGYDVFNAVVTANINGSLFHVKMIEEWCGLLQWIDNCCCKKKLSEENSD